jgi:hypothetical protein
MVGSNNFPNSSNMCHGTPRSRCPWPSGAGGDRDFGGLQENGVHFLFRPEYGHEQPAVSIRPRGGEPPPIVTFNPRAWLQTLQKPAVHANHVGGGSAARSCEHVHARETTMPLANESPKKIPDTPARRIWTKVRSTQAHSGLEVLNEHALSTRSRRHVRTAASASSVMDLKTTLPSSAATIALRPRASLTCGTGSTRVREVSGLSTVSLFHRKPRL